MRIKGESACTKCGRDVFGPVSYCPFCGMSFPSGRIVESPDQDVEIEEAVSAPSEPPSPPPPPPSDAEITVQSEPSGAIVRIDGIQAGTTPALLKNVRPGRHLIEVSKDGYETKTVSGETQAGGRETVTVSLLKIPPPPPLVIEEPVDGPGTKVEPKKKSRIPMIAAIVAACLVLVFVVTRLVTKAPEGQKPVSRSEESKGGKGTKGFEPPRPLPREPKKKEPPQVPETTPPVTQQPRPVPSPVPPVSGSTQPLPKDGAGYGSPASPQPPSHPTIPEPPPPPPPTVAPSIEPSPRTVVPDPAIEEDLKDAIRSFEQGQYDIAIVKFDYILKRDAGNQKAIEYRKLAQEKKQEAYEKFRKNVEETPYSGGKKM